MPTAEPTSWPELICEPVATAVATIRRQRPDIREVRVVPQNQAPSPATAGRLRLVIYNNARQLVVLPAPHLG